jgi:hypothetical protein
VLWLKLFVGVLTFSFVTTITPGPSLSPIDTSGWKIYRNETMGFEAKYPHTWQVRLVKGTGPESVSLDESRQGGKPSLSVQFWVQRQINPKGLSIDQWYADQLHGIKSAPDPTTKTVIGGRPALRREVVGTWGRHFDFFIALNKTDVFEITIIQRSSQPQLDQTHEALLSTVKFLN